MRIVGFGDSFIMQSSDPGAYLNLVAKEFDAELDFKGYPGTGPWDTFFQIKDYTKEIDVAVICWSEFGRLYNSYVRGICPGSIWNHHEGNQKELEIWDAALKYYQHLYDGKKIDYEAEAFYQWVDSWTKRFAGIKFIHMWSFAKVRAGGDFYSEHRKDRKDLEYYHSFKNGAEIRPALMHYSVNGDWPGDIKKDPRTNHLNNDFHKYVANFIIDAIKTYQPGKIYQPS